MKKNDEKFETLKKFNLPLGHYAIIGSGPLGIRNLRAIADIDIIVSEELWNILADKYEIVEEHGIKKIVFPGNLIEAFCESSFDIYIKDKDQPTISERITQADIINQLPFESLDNTIYFKRKMGREKDLQDIAMIEQLQKDI